MSVKLTLRDKEFIVKPGMTLRDSLFKIDVLPETVLATRQGEMITEDEVLQDGDEIKLIAVISGGYEDDKTEAVLLGINGDEM
ncbi:MAG: MoaD/ThiS family protein [Anaerolineales bacterium]|nr:MoaD/ThiS family protein [Anaerolineales bacterium]